MDGLLQHQDLPFHFFNSLKDCLRTGWSGATILVAPGIVWRDLPCFLWPLAGASLQYWTLTQRKLLATRKLFATFGVPTAELAALMLFLHAVGVNGLFGRSPHIHLFRWPVTQPNAGILSAFTKLSRWRENDFWNLKGSCRGPSLTLANAVYFHCLLTPSAGWAYDR